MNLEQLRKNKKIAIALSSVMAAFIQFLGYGTGFLRSVYRLYFQRKGIKEAFPRMFA